MNSGNFLAECGSLTFCSRPTNTFLVLVDITEINVKSIVSTSYLIAVIMLGRIILHILFPIFIGIFSLT
jgi:hypothetical protein